MAKLGDVFKDIFNEYVDVGVIQKTKESIDTQLANLEQNKIGLQRSSEELKNAIDQGTKANVEEKKLKDIATKKAADEAKQATDEKRTGLTTKEIPGKAPVQPQE